MIAIAFVAGGFLGLLTGVALGIFIQRDRRVSHEPADIKPALKRPC